MATINFDDKEAMYENANIPEKNKITAPNVNLIKLVSNQILKTLGVYTDNWSSSSTYNIGDIAIYDNRVFENLTGTNTATTPDLDTTNWEETTIASMAAGAASGDTLPIGSIMPYGKDTAPANWLVCDGSAVSRTTYANLFAVIGTSFGSGDGSTTFNLPNLKGKVAVGKDTTQTEFDTMGETGGEKTHTLTIDEMPSHSHQLGTLSSGSDARPAWNGSRSDVQDAWVFTKEAGGDQPHNNLQPYQVVCYIIKADQSAGLVANVSKTYSTSETDTYSCDYINGIIESGSNTNGEYVKYADGTMICTGAKSGTTTWEDWWSFCKRSPEGSNMLFASFPQAFINGNARVSITTSHGNAVFSASYNSVQTDGFYFICYKPSSNTSTNYGIQYIAVGRWK